jgi:hypothetical protein
MHLRVAPHQTGTPLLGRDAPYDLLWQVTACTHLMGDAALADTPLTVASSSLLPHPRHGLSKGLGTFTYG